MFDRILPGSEDVARELPGDHVIASPTATIDSAFELPHAPADVFPWFLQLGKQRAGWYFPRSVERLLPRGRRGLRHVERRWQGLSVGDRIPDYGGKDGYFDCFHLDVDRAIGYRSERGRVAMTWVLTFRPEGDGTHVHVRLRVRTRKDAPGLLLRLGAIFDRLTILGLAAGVEERVREERR